VDDDAILRVVVAEQDVEPVGTGGPGGTVR